ncbi:MAG: hypothetical protein JO313_07525 [Verrucomicrobia bacterium]|nr:hypothetical protein [Verrucomicrobiota bacterium]
MTSRWIVRGATRFLGTMKHARMVYLRNGGFSWRLQEDLGRVNSHWIRIMVPFWSQCLFQAARSPKPRTISSSQPGIFMLAAVPLKEQLFPCVKQGPAQIPLVTEKS